MSVQKSLGAMLQGVSQQPTRIRQEGQVSEQINFVSDVATGLTSRPATVAGGMLEGASGDMKFREITFGTDLYQLGFAKGDLKIWDLEGSPQTLDGGDNSYITEDMQFHVIVDKDNVEKAYATNRTTKVRMVANTNKRDFNVGIVTALGGELSRRYQVRWTFSGGSEVYAFYGTESGEDENDASTASSDAIIKGLFESAGLAVSAHETPSGWGTDPVPIPEEKYDVTYEDAAYTGYLPFGAELTYDGDVLLMKHKNQTIEVDILDGDAGTVLRATTETVRDITDLPDKAPQGTIVRVSGDEASSDDYYLKFVLDDDSYATGNGFGEEGVWEETAAPGLSHRFSPDSMPHVLIRRTDGTFKFDVEYWGERDAGDEETNPLPSFVGRAIRDIGSFESRLVFLSGSNFIASRSRYPIEFFKKSATVLADSDPIDETSTQEGSAQLDWIVPFDRDLLLISDPGSAQFVVTGGGLTPSNASMVLTTSYQMSGNTRPATTGRTVIFPFLNGGFSGIKEFFTNDSVATNGANTLTEVQSRYIPGKVRHIASSENFNIILLTSDHEDYGNVVWVYKYLWDGGEKLQSSWSKWVFADKVEHLFFDNSVVHMTMRYENTFRLASLDLNRPEDTVLGYHPTFDRQEIMYVKEDTNGDPYVDLPYSDPRIVQRLNCPQPGSVLEVHRIVSVGDASGIIYRYFLPDFVSAGMEVLVGQPFERVLTPSMPTIKDRFGNTISAANIVVTKFMLWVENSGNVHSVMDSPYREPFTFTPYLYPIDDDPLDPTGVGLQSGMIEIPWGEDTTYSTLTIKSDDVKPTTILELAWEGNITGRKQIV